MGENFKDLILSRTNLKDAWDEVSSKKAAAGADNITISRWQRNWEANLERLAEQVNSNTYIPNRPKRIKVLQKNGKLRELSLLTVTDKVLQRAFLNIIEPHFECRFLKCSHAYRRNRSTATAIQQLLNYRDSGLRWVLDADLLDCFDHIDHLILTNLFKRVINDRFVIDLLQKWLTAGRKERHKPVGIAQGGVISPLLCNIYLHQLDAKMTCGRWHFIRYADDFIVMTAAQEQAEASKFLVEQMLDKLKLQFNLRKTNVTNFEKGFTFLGVDFLGNTYEYIWRNKRIQVEGQKLRILYQYIPELYS